jgi:hypothetical protein
MNVILGDEEMRTISNKAKLPLNRAGSGAVALERDLSLQDLISLQKIMKKTYGPQGRDGVAIHAGRVFFIEFFRQNGMTLGFLNNEYRMLPTKKRIAAGLNILAEAMSERLNVPFRLVEDVECWKFEVCYSKNKPGCEDLVDPSLYFLVGLIQEYLAWASGGKIYPVQKNGNTSPPLVISIMKKPLS